MTGFIPLYPSIYSSKTYEDKKRILDSFLNIQINIIGLKQLK